jgi:hypothetical protein
LKNNQQISEDDLCTVVAALYLKEYQTKLEALLNSKYLKTYYAIEIRIRAESMKKGKPGIMRNFASFGV